ncbi:hypothetical protein PsorP6_017905 [Peronosclerospora sorghi]|uniref:Uncharacterized protein n=1 Tax=Peronosclerospora sorghi TaxID=230839 RepID=A0ACC0WD21_9STRA|nr:hypothetical protein PsorP6_017905 [Peronosclerospora sorghi]
MKHGDLVGASVPVPPEVKDMTTLARMAEMMESKQLEMAQLLQHHRVVLDKLSSGRSTVEKRMEGISMLTYHGRVVNVALPRKDIDVQASANQRRHMTMVASNSEGSRRCMVYFDQDKFTSLCEVADALQPEFIPPDLKERLQIEIFSLRKANCDGLEYYVSRFHTIICQVRDMSHIDQITWFRHGLVMRIREEVAYRRFTTGVQGYFIALELERSHPQSPVARRDDQNVNSAEHGDR